MTYGPFGLYVRLGAEPLNGFNMRNWGGYYYASGTVSYASYSAPATRTNIAAFEVRPWGWPIPWTEIANATGVDEERLRTIVATLLKPHTVSVEVRGAARTP